MCVYLAFGKNVSGVGTIPTTAKCDNGGAQFFIFLRVAGYADDDVLVHTADDKDRHEKTEIDRC